MSMTRCANCDGEFEESELYETYDGYVCASCAEEYTECEHCGILVKDDDCKGTRDGRVCRSCFDHYYTECNHCGEYVMTGNCVDTRDGLVCPSCLERDYAICDHCDEYAIRVEMTYIDTEGLICSECLENDYSRCTGCGGYFRNEDLFTDISGDDYCENCRDPEGGDYEDDDCYIYAYHSGHPRGLAFWGKDEHDIYLGMELEVDKGGKDEENASEVLDILDDSHAHCEKDGSLSDGFEIISQPFTIDYWHKELKARYAKACGYLIRNGYASHNTCTCGLHVHVSRKGLGNTKDKMYATIGKIATVMEMYWPEFKQFSRRKNRQLESYAAKIDAGIHKNVDDIPTIIEKINKCASSRYFALNLTNNDTIEFRLFQGTLRIETITATLELVYGLVRMCRESDLDAIYSGTGWENLLDTIYWICNQGEENPALSDALREYSITRKLISTTTEEE